MVALCPVVRNPVKFAIEGDKGKSQVVSFIQGLRRNGTLRILSHLKKRLFTSLFG